MIGEILESNKTYSAYQPSPDVAELTKNVKQDYTLGDTILTSPWTELNGYSIIDDANKGQKMFNAFVDESSEDATQAWKWKGTRSIARNKGIAMHAQLTVNYLIPLFIAQNDNDEIDRDFSEVMRDIIEWMALPTNSDYQSSFLQVTFGMMENPITYLGAEFYEVYQTIREQTEKGYEKKEVLDEVLSGFKAPVYGPSEVLLTNAYERNIQKQRAIIKRRWIDYSEAKALYGDHENWEYVRPGYSSVCSEEGLFYDIKDDEHPYMVEEVTWLNRREDAEVCFLGGVYVGDSNVENNPIRHRDNRGTPKYNVVPFGYMRIGEHFAYYKSMMNSLRWDNDLYDAMSEIIMNNALLEQDPPTAVFGTDKVDSTLNFPGAIAAFEDAESKVTPIFPPKNFVAGFQALRETEKSIQEGSVNETLSGQLPDASQKAFNVAQAQQNAQKLISAVHKSLGESITLYGDLMKDIALNHITVPQVEELVGDKMKTKYRTLVLQGKQMNERTVDKRLVFESGLIGREMTPEQVRKANLNLYSKTRDKNAVVIINPELFAKFKFYSKIDIQEMFAKNQQYWQALLSQLAAQLANNPYINQEALTRKLVHAFFQSEGEDLINAQPQQQAFATPETQLGRQAVGKQLSTSLQGMI